MKGYTIHRRTTPIYAMVGVLANCPVLSSFCLRGRYHRAHDFALLYSSCGRKILKLSTLMMPCETNRPKTALRLSATDELDLSTAASLLRSGRVVAFPTETVYGLGADATNPIAVSAIFAAKRRPPDNPLIVHISSQADLSRHALTPMPLPPIASKLAEAFWPGPLTMVLPLSANSNLAPAVTASLPSVAIRVPHHPVAAALLSRAMIPIAAPSANLSGRPSPTCAHHVLRDLANDIDAVVDIDHNVHLLPSERCGLESTVVDLTSSVPTVLRPGAVSISQLENVSGLAFERAYHAPSSEASAPKAPGMKYRHYAPKSPLYIVESSLASTIQEWKKSATRIGLLADQQICNTIGDKYDVVCVACGNDGTAASFARALYAALRAFDGEGDMAVYPPVDVILAVPPKQVEDGIGEAVMNRLKKAAAGRADVLPGLT